MSLGLERLFHRKRSDQELDEELQAHLAMATRDRIERGEDPQAAALAARREFGNRALIQETTREMWGWSALTTFWQDVRYALRGMRRSPGFTAVVVLSMALGIGANTAIFSLINALMLRTLPVHDPGRLVELLFKAPRQDHFNAFDWRNYQHYRGNNHVFSGLIAASDTPFTIRGAGLEPEIVRGGFVSTNYFSTLGVNPVLGRLIGPEDGSPGSPANVAVVSWSYWQNRFNRDRAIVGRQISDGNQPLTIVGVAQIGRRQPGLARQRRGGELVLLAEQVQPRPGDCWKANQRWQPAADDCGSRPQRLRWSGTGEPSRHLVAVDGEPTGQRDHRAVLGEIGGASEAGCLHRAGTRRDERPVAVDPGAGIQSQ